MEHDVTLFDELVVSYNHDEYHSDRNYRNFLISSVITSPSDLWRFFKRVYMHHSEEDGIYSGTLARDSFFADKRQVALIDGKRYIGMTYGATLPTYFDSKYDEFGDFLREALGRARRFEKYQEEKKKRTRMEESLSNKLAGIPVEDLENYIKQLKNS